MDCVNKSLYLTINYTQVITEGGCIRIKGINASQLIKKNAFKSIDIQRKYWLRFRNTLSNFVNFKTEKHEKPKAQGNSG